MESREVTMKYIEGSPSSTLLEDIFYSIIALISLTVRKGIVTGFGKTKTEAAFVFCVPQCFVIENNIITHE